MPEALVGASYQGPWTSWDVPSVQAPHECPHFRLVDEDGEVLIEVEMEIEN